ncbi:pimeloyl-ACP methyl ester carboxylesterase [Kibdelosporangium banguiense]|uniref:Pimeloyl-ACP methyl ester carboxylesterase n=1 Tax=Kibdelosporangium banguiense TaxID=1365924 RepID=A0ABS4TX25_9PSEU|nr:alpha/beta hydrolase [Kibdelosporangium banguiense]MBP2328939.1 pimeloyl-ACP methyl ester carboxylesterase [Kibdelosporangium banguiense]
MGGIVLVHGAWHGAWCWDGVVAELRQRGVAATAVELPLAGLAADVAAARAAIQAAGPASVVVAHSYGGLVVSYAAAGLSTVSRLVYLAAYLTEPDEDVSALMSGKLTESLVFRDGEVSVDPAAAAGLFYGDAAPGTAAELAGRLRPMTIGVAVPPVVTPAWRSIPTTYVVCTNDQAIPAGSQRRMAARAETVVEWPTDHSPFVTRPRVVADLVAGHPT